MNRRTFLLAAGGTLALVGAAGVWRVTRRPETATLPWDLPSPPPTDIRLDAFRHAILAPNPHNRQPWVIRLVGQDEAVINADLSRLLPQTDPFDRQIVIGFGAFLELARLAAAERGAELIITPFPDGGAQRLDARPIAHLRFAATSPAKDPLFAQIPARRSNKEAYDLSRPVTDAELARLTVPLGIAGHAADAAKVAALRAIVLEAVGIEYALPRTMQESVDVMRIGHAEVDASPDGIDLHGPMIESLKLAGMIGRAQLADPQSQAFRSGAEMMQQTYGAAPAFVWITTEANERATQLAAGAAYARLNLAAAAAGLSMHPMSQSLQEFPEMAGPYAAIHRLLAPAGERVQMLARIGHGPAVPPAPRWPLEAKLVV